MSLDYLKIHTCRNYCILYKQEYENLKKCTRCLESRYKQKNNGDEHGDCVTRKCVPSKVTWYLPIIQRFKRLFANVNYIKNTRWHANERVCDGKICHVAYSLCHTLNFPPNFLFISCIFLAPFVKIFCKRTKIPKSQLLLIWIISFKSCASFKINSFHSSYTFLHH